MLTIWIPTVQFVSRYPCKVGFSNKYQQVALFQNRVYFISVWRNEFIHLSFQLNCVIQYFLKYLPVHLLSFVSLAKVFWSFFPKNLSQYHFHPVSTQIPRHLFQKPDSFFLSDWYLDHQLKQDLTLITMKVTSRLGIAGPE